jgi:hypothetical protein
MVRKERSRAVVFGKNLWRRSLLTPTPALRADPPHKGEG